MKQINRILSKTCVGVLFSIGFMLFNTNSYAETTPPATVNDKPITIDADNQQIDIKQDSMTFTGNVVIQQGELTVNADSVVITEMKSKDNQIITAKGNPVRFMQYVDNDPTKIIKGHSQQLIYNVRKNQVTLIEKAELTRQDNHITSDKIIYDVDEQKIQAQSGKNNRVKTTIIPNQVQEIKK